MRQKRKVFSGGIIVKKLSGVVFAILLLLPVCANAIITKDFYNDGQIVDGNYFNEVNVWNTATVNMTGGSVIDGGIDVHNTATFNFSGGSPGWISAYDNSTANITGGFSAAYVTDHATVNISGNASVARADAGNSGILNVYSGTIGQLNGDDSAVVNIYDGAIGGIDGLGAYGSSIFNLMGGSIAFIHADYGENIPILFSTINVFGCNLSKTSTGGTFGYGQITGFWQNGSQFAIDFRDTHTNLNINLIPEPTTFLLFGVGMFLLRKSRRKNQKSE